MKCSVTGIMTAVLLIVIGNPVFTAWAGSQPDFNNPDAVLTDLRAKIDACSASHVSTCMSACGYAFKVIKNIVKSNPGGDPGILKQRWQSCFDAYRNAGSPSAPSTAKAPATPKSVKTATRPAQQDLSKFVVSGLQLGGDMNTQKTRFFYLAAYGYHKQTGLEHNDYILQKGASRPGPDIIRNYSGLIKESPVYIKFEAAADGRIYMIQFEQKEDMNVKEVQSALIKRYGKPTRYQGNYLFWGCSHGPQEGLCVKAQVSSRSLNIWAFDGDIKSSAYKRYRKNMLEAKGVKSGAKF